MTEIQLCDCDRSVYLGLSVDTFVIHRSDVFALLIYY